MTILYLVNILALKMALKLVGSLVKLLFSCIDEAKAESMQEKSSTGCGNSRLCEF